MSDTEEPFQVMKHKKCRRKYKYHSPQLKSTQELYHVNDDVVEAGSVLEKLHDCR